MRKMIFNMIIMKYNDNIKIKIAIAIIIKIITAMKQ